MKNRVSSLLMETGISYNKEKLHHKKYFGQLLREQEAEMPESLPQLLRLSRTTIETLSSMDRQLLRMLQQDAVLADRVERLITIPGVGLVVALTWALEAANGCLVLLIAGTLAARQHALETEVPRVEIETRLRSGFGSI